MNETIIEELAERFIRWPVPRSVCCDLCATKQQDGRIGTNLLSFEEAKQMMREVVAPLLSGQAEHKPAGEKRESALFTFETVDGVKEYRPTEDAEEMFRDFCQNSNVSSNVPINMPMQREAFMAGLLEAAPAVAAPVAQNEGSARLKELAKQWEDRARTLTMMADELDLSEMEERRRLQCKAGVNRTCAHELRAAYECRQQSERGQPQ